MPPTSAYRIQVRTDSADRNAILLLKGGELVAILVELSDESHDDFRGRWIVEAIFGLNVARRPASFASAQEAADWVGEHVCRGPFHLSSDIAELR